MKNLLKEYAAKRDFKKTAEPGPKLKKAKQKKLSFVVQEHHASHLHYDFRLEWDGVLKSWAVPKGPSMDPGTKRLAVEVEDHPVEYGKFEGVIPAHEYGAGQVYIWDKGTWEPDGDVEASLSKGHLDFTLKGKKLKGKWVLVRTRGIRGGDKPNWLLMKRSDQYSNAQLSDLEPIISEKAGTPLKRVLKTATKATKATKTTAKKKARKGKSLSFIQPQLSLLVDAPPEGEEWLHEMKFDGYRIETVVQNGVASLLTRSGQDWSSKYPAIEREMKEMPVTDAIFDGEVVVLNQQGKSDFQALQQAIKAGEAAKLVYFVFDLLHLNGQDLRTLPLIQRKELLKQILTKAKQPNVRFSDHIEGSGLRFYNGSCRQDLEGIVSKRKDAPYVSGRTDIWVKTKCMKRQEFVIAGYTDPKGERKGFGALLLGVYEDGKLRYTGRTGTGFNHEGLMDLLKQLKKLETEKNPFELNAPRERGLHWVKPKLVAEVSFSNWTEDGVLRVPVFQGLRADKPAKMVKKETETHLGKNKFVREAQAMQTQTRLGKIKLPPKGKKNTALDLISHAEKVLFQKDGVTKGEVAEYYQAVSPLILPHLSDRPLALVRCPDGTQGDCFFQKHVPDFQVKIGAKGKNPLHGIPIQESKGLKTYTSVDTLEGVLALVQMGAFELHAWNCRQPDIESPDQFVMDFDPDPGIPFKRVIEGVLTLKKLLDKLGLKSFVKTTGGKGLHVHVPIAPQYTWDQVKEFSKSLAQMMAEAEPEKYTAVLSKKDRVGKIFIDYLRNGRGATAVAPYSVRAKDESFVAMPIRWEDVKKLKRPNEFNVPKAIAHLKKRRSDPWKGMLGLKQKLHVLDAH